MWNVMPSALAKANKNVKVKLGLYALLISLLSYLSPNPEYYSQSIAVDSFRR